MKCKLVVIAMALLATSVAHANGCSLISLRTQELAQKFKKHGGWVAPSFEEKCEKINRANARVLITSGSAVLANRSIGWANVNAMDKNSNIMTNDYSSSITSVHSYASEDKSDELEVDAVNSAFNEWTQLDQALAALEKERQKVRKGFTKEK